LESLVVCFVRGLGRKSKKPETEKGKAVKGLSSDACYETQKLPLRGESLKNWKMRIPTRCVKAGGGGKVKERGNGLGGVFGWCWGGVGPWCQSRLFGSAARVKNGGAGEEVDSYSTQGGVRRQVKSRYWVTG